jgi:murein L,D-transpeptidase YcbB/YkuD
MGMVKKVKILSLIILFIFFISLTGCASLRKKDLTSQELRNQTQALEAELQKKNEEIALLKEKLKEKEEISKSSFPEAKRRPSVKQIQLALRNAGYNPGPIDGKMGKQTRQAIKAFQKANGLTPDGKVGRKTWELLRQYLYKKDK